VLITRVVSLPATPGGVPSCYPGGCCSQDEVCAQQSPLLLPGVGCAQQSPLLLPGVRNVHNVDSLVVVDQWDTQRCTYCSLLLKETHIPACSSLNGRMLGIHHLRTTSGITGRKMRNCSNPTINQEGIHLRITPLPRGNRSIKPRKPATESTCAQGCQ